MIACAEVKAHGQIASMALPLGWLEAPDNPRSDMDAATLRKFHPEGLSDIQLCLYYRGMPMSEHAAAEFHGLLCGQAHSLTRSEIRSVEGALEGLGNETVFDILSARTEDLNGKLVLIVEGRWKEIDTDTYHILLDADGTGAQVQEIYFAAPRSQYPSRIQEAKAAIKSIAWK